MRRERAERIIADLKLRRSAEFIDVLISEESSDVEACPGSGKTTSLALKVAVELSFWTQRHRGVLILSHTNVAKREIEKAAATMPGCADVLRPPHFIGTIQAFVDRFLALPYLRGKGLQPKIIGDVFSAAYFDRAISEPQFRTGRTWLERNNRNVEDLELGVDVGTITLGGEQLGIGRETASYRQLLALKHRSIASGIFRYGDMYAFAERCVRDEPRLIEVLRNRFPLVLIDEMQDTNERQVALLEALFPRAHVRIHRFGDSNQAIFGSGRLANGNDAFPKQPILPLTESQRFGRFIAGAVSGVSANGQVILGAAGVEDGAPHAILLFAADTVERVIPAFAEIVASTAQPGTQVLAYAVGYKKAAPTPRAGELRANLSSYLPSFCGSAYEAAYGTFMSHIVDARRVLAKSGLHEAMQSAKRGLRELFERWDAGNGSNAYAAMQLSVGNRSSFYAVLLHLLLQAELPREVWQAQIEAVCRLCNNWFDGQSATNLREYLAFDSSIFEREVKRNSAIYEFGEQISVEVAVDTIHGVKGETHSATLVLETYNRSHDLQRLMPFISGQQRICGNESTADQMRLRAIYVAMSRPRNLVCLALQASHLSREDERILGEKGWRIQRL